MAVQPSPLKVPSTYTVVGYYEDTGQNYRVNIEGESPGDALHRLYSGKSTLDREAVIVCGVFPGAFAQSELVINDMCVYLSEWKYAEATMRVGAELLGTDLRLSAGQPVHVKPATNQPSRRDGKQQYFVAPIGSTDEDAWLLVTEDDITHPTT